MTPEQYENAKRDLIEKKWKIKNLTGSDSFTQHMKMQIDLLEALISKYEDCYHVNKPVIHNINIYTEVLK